MMEEIKAALEQIDQKIIRKEQEIERCEKRLKDAKAELVRARDRRNTIIGTYITTLGGGDTKSLDAFFTLAQETLSMPQEERAAKAADDTTGEPAAKIEDLPILPEVWKTKVKPGAKKQYLLIKKLVHEADEIVNAGDPDREGQLLVDEVLADLQILKGSKPIRRILLNALDEKSVREALRQLRSNQEFIGLRNSALARSRADWLIGMNLSRIYTIRTQQAGYTNTVSVGRVQTPTMGLVVHREIEIRKFRPITFFTPCILWQHEAGSFLTRWKPHEMDGVDPEGRIVQRETAEQILSAVRSAPANISGMEQKKGTSPQRLPYSLSALQIDAGKMFGYAPQEFLSTKIEVTAGEEIFTASGKVIFQDGWSVLYQKEQHDTEDDTDQAQHLPSVRKGDFVACQDEHIKESVTKPPVRFTPATLLKAMKEIHKYVKDAGLKDRLKECSGIGTEATRAFIIETLQKREYIRLEKKQLVPTELGISLCKILPDKILFPDITAQWESDLDRISTGSISIKDFFAQQEIYLRELISSAKTATIAPPKNSITCPQCAKPMRRLKSAKGYFWGCTGYPECKATFPDKNGKPDTATKGRRFK